MVDVDGVLVDGRPEDGRHWQTSIRESLSNQEHPRAAWPPLSRGKSLVYNCPQPRCWCSSLTPPNESRSPNRWPGRCVAGGTPCFSTAKICHLATRLTTAFSRPSAAATS